VRFGDQAKYDLAQDLKMVDEAKALMKWISDMPNV